MTQRSELHSAVILCASLCTAIQNLSIGGNVVSKGSPSRILRVLRISFGITILPKSSTRRTIPVAFIYLSPFLVGYKASLVQRELAARRADGGIVFFDILQSPSQPRRQPPLHKGAFSRAYNNFSNYAVSICKRDKIILITKKRAYKNRLVCLCSINFQF